jgi:hypothetical protein
MALQLRHTFIARSLVQELLRRSVVVQLVLCGSWGFVVHCLRAEFWHSLRIFWWWLTPTSSPKKEAENDERNKRDNAHASPDSCLGSCIES